MPGTTAGIVGTAVFVALAVVSRRAAGTRWAWALPIALSIDNITFGLIDHSWTTSTWGQAGEQALSSVLLAGLGLLAAAAVVRTVPALQRSRVALNGFAGAAPILAAGVELLIG